MDLIYADKNKTDVGVLKDFSFDLAYGSGENDFEVSISVENNVCQEDYILYIENTEYGGIIDTIEVDTECRKMKYKGRTWHGVLNTKIIQPDAGAAYYTVSGDANTIIGTVISRLSLGALFRAKSEASGITINNYKFKRYVSGFDGLTAMLLSQDAKLHIEYLPEGIVELSAVPIVSYAEDELVSDHVSFHIKKTYNPINHLVCLGQGELADRTVIHLYCDADGNISTTQTFFGVDEVANVYNYPNVESPEELQTEGTKRLKELNDQDEVKIDLDDTYSFDIGDIVTAIDNITGISVTRRVKKKIVKINKDIVTVNYEVGE